MICGLQTSARRQQPRFGFPRSRYSTVSDESRHPDSVEKDTDSKVRSRVFIETREILIIKRKRVFVPARCEGRGREVDLLPLTEAVLLTGRGV